VINDSHIDKVLHDILKREGWPTYTEHPDDRGGPTKGGITLATLRSWRRKPGMYGGTANVQKRHLQNLKEEEALAILKQRYVKCNGIDKVENPELQAQIIDDAVLSGPYLAVKDLQKTVNVDQDGIIGSKTLAAIELNNPIIVNRKLAVERSLRLARFVQKNPNQLVFLVGWLKRCLEFVQ
jgi:lysozyme family protein